MASGNDRVDQRGSTPFVGFMYLVNKLGWRPRPGLDLDAGIRVQRVAPESNWDSIQAQVNQYGSPTRYLNGFPADHTAAMWANTAAMNPRFGPGYDIPPDPDVQFWPDAITGLEKTQFGE